jgi:hypothetical protein
MSDRVSDFTLEQYLLDELEPAERARLSERLELDEVLAARLGRLRESNRAILADYRPEDVGPAIESRLHAEQRSPRGGRNLFVLGPIAAVLAILAVALPLRMAQRDSAQTRIKGLESRLEVYRQGPSGAERLADGARAVAGDVLQIRYAAGGARFGVVFSVDGNHVVTRHWPEDGNQAAELQSGGLVALPYAYELDDAPDYERFFFVTSGDPFAISALESAIQTLLRGEPKSDPLDLPEELEQASFSVSKE